MLCLRRNAYTVEDKFHFLLVCPHCDKLMTFYLPSDWKNEYPSPVMLCSIVSDTRSYQIKSLAKIFDRGILIKKLLVVLEFNATLTAKVISWRSVTHMCFLAFSHQY